MVLELHAIICGGQFDFCVHEHRARKTGMGIVTMGVPEQIVTELATLNNSTIFVETGTYRGGTTRWAAQHFRAVHTVERSEELFGAESAALTQLAGVSPHLGDSRDVLPKILEEIGDHSAVFWLDSHWSGGITAGVDDECPVIDELAILSGRVDDIILIDDARLFLCAPPAPHNPRQWPTISDIVEASSIQLGGRRFVQVVDDVIFIIPDKEELRDHLISYSQSRASEFWQTFAKFSHLDNAQSRRPPLPHCVSRLASRLRQKFAAK